jgi:quaternary ammonium compound-resistance protein SugE
VAWAILFVAGLCEVAWAVGLKYTHGFTRALPVALVLVAMVASVWLLAIALRTIPLGTGYAVWTGVGAVGTALAGILFFEESRDLVRLLCILLIVAGIAGLKLATPAS